MSSTFDLLLSVPQPHSVLRAMKVAEYQAPLAACADARVLSLVRQHVDRCEALGVALLCCPEALLGGLADYVDQPDRIAIETGTNHLARMLAPLASDRVTTVIGFTERGRDGHLYNAAAVFARGAPRPGVLARRQAASYRSSGLNQMRYRLDVTKLAGLLRGRVVSDFEANSDHLALRFGDGSALVIERTSRGVTAVLHEIANRREARSKDRPTLRQREYLEFIRKYMGRHGVSPAESDIADHFMVSAPSAHLMVKTLDRRGFLTRDRDIYGSIIPRSIRVLID